MGRVCRSCWVLTAGYVKPKNCRVARTEAAIRRGERGHPGPRTDLQPRLNKSSYARAMMTEFCIKHSQCSPADTIMYVDFCGVSKLFKLYAAELPRKKRLKFSSFKKIWRKLLRDGLYDPETAVHFTLRIRKTRARGFAKCNLCEYFKCKMRGTSSRTKRAGYQRGLQKHIDEINEDREELARIQRWCMRCRTHCGFYIDAADSAKFQIPTTATTGKMMSKLWRIRQKLTCVQMFTVQKELYMFRTLPDVPHGGNLTCTIISRMFNTGLFVGCTDLYINIDGAGDNVCYTVMYFLVHVLLCAHAIGWCLRRIHVLRCKVGHTHNDLDATFAGLSKAVYGKHSRGDPRTDILSLKAFEVVTTTRVSAHNLTVYFCFCFCTVCMCHPQIFTVCVSVCVTRRCAKRSTAIALFSLRRSGKITTSTRS